ncbi:TraR/DksA C4-type zinc finger protein [Clostridium lacusfryxellense]|uniref:TraR/DksA C4-type zinc finger protein n=1 Tax=Clostridium lacusfryxellense TaxID=205328 RepID=UPI001C0E7EE8|nr:TraR/DksA C4-type zinc finger protein [Clostridium lacusfryxellense]MBU3111830.1 TraR/DksA C4-type zinc finger protein [Clostridium lacusfryxellense]
MEKKRLNHFKEKLISEQLRVLNLIDQMKQNGVINSNSEMASELSFYDNHPSDLATELFDKEKGLALKGNEISILNKIGDSLKSIENGSYGKCASCGNDITLQRLEFIPYAENCLECQKSIANHKPAEQNNRCVEEDLLGSFFKYSNSGEVGVDAEDTYQAVEHFNDKLDEIVEDDDEDNYGYVDPIEKISNQQYKNQLPD